MTTSPGFSSPPAPPTRSRRPLLLVLGGLGLAALIAGLVLLLLPTSAPVGPIIGDGGEISSVDCGTAFSGPHLTGVLTDIDAETGGPGLFQTMADTACAHAGGAKHGFGWVLGVIGLIALLTAGFATFTRRLPPTDPPQHG